jgi:hypothetical protein
LLRCVSLVRIRILRICEVFLVKLVSIDLIIPKAVSFAFVISVRCSKHAGSPKNTLALLRRPVSSKDGPARLRLGDNAAFALIDTLIPVESVLASEVWLRSQRGYSWKTRLARTNASRLRRLRLASIKNGGVLSWMKLDGVVLLVVRSQMILLIAFHQHFGLPLAQITVAELLILIAVQRRVRVLYW